MITQNARNLVHRESSRPSEVQRSSVVRAISGQHGNRNIGDIRLGDNGRPPLARWSANLPIGTDEMWREVGVDVVAQDRVRHSY
jgi:hypothetical protein